jgi:hypothetical protein
MHYGATTPPHNWISDAHARPKFTHYGTSGSLGAAVGAQAISEATEMPLEAHGAAPHPAGLTGQKLPPKPTFQSRDTTVAGLSKYTQIVSAVPKKPCCGGNQLPPSHRP